MTHRLWFFSHGVHRYLAYNGLLGLPQSVFAALTQLLEVYLDENNLTDLDEGLFDTLTGTSILCVNAHHCVFDALSAHTHTHTHTHTHQCTHTHR